MLLLASATCRVSSFVFASLISWNKNEEAMEKDQSQVTALSPFEKRDRIPPSSAAPRQDSVHSIVLRIRSRFCLHRINEPLPYLV